MAFNPTTTREASQGNGINVLVYGEAGAGKTRLCATTGDLDATLIISCEGGLLSLREYDISVAKVESLEDINDVYQYLKREDNPFKWVCLDSLSEIAEVVLAAEKVASRDPRQAYGSTFDKVMSMVRDFRDLPINVFFTAKMKTVEVGKDDSKRYYYRPAMPGNNLTNEIPYQFDELFVLHAKDRGEVTERYLQTFKNSFTAKDRSGSLDRKELADLEHIANKINGCHNHAGE